MHKLGKLIISQEQIRRGVESVARELEQDFAGLQPVFISVVPGGIFFTADLLRQLNFALAMDTISCPHVPGSQNNTSTIVYQQNINIKQRHVILLDDAIESGGTMSRLCSHISETFQPASLSIATLFVKQRRKAIAFKQYFAYEIDNNEILVGYGLPWQDHWRNLPTIAELKR
ncbi:phosphoribosyltransferase [Agaribacterium haliotis]|uniref:phosphoribosyltransferase n=1 Tax=Agaribacterium haliotis TaxID=2013869 RepID=UPI000BB55FDE|nr:phosphoribosyltransferase family protein [Agaribacterium haliotis]